MESVLPRSVILAGILSLFLGRGAAGQPIPEHDAQLPGPDELAARLVPPNVIGALEDNYLNIEAQMRAHNVPGISVAVIEDGHIIWTATWGTGGPDMDMPLTTGARFQAASISKPVTAAAFLSLAEDGIVSLDADINDYLEGWSIEASPPLTAREILSHTAGLTMSGFPGYEYGQAIPDLTDILNGASPANTSPVVHQPEARGTFQYSGGGYTIIQKAIEDVTGQSFADVLADRVLGPAGMTASTFVPPAREDTSYVSGFRPDGSPVPGRWHEYPELAAAGLWTTAEDLARFGLNIAGHATTGQEVLHEASVREMLTEQVEGAGLGFRVLTAEADGETTRAFFHTGLNDGYQSNLFMFEDASHGVAVLANNTNSTAVVFELIRGVSVLYDWPAFHKPSLWDIREMTAELVDRVTGTYRAARDGDILDMEVDWDGETLGYQVAGAGPRHTLYWIGDGVLMARNQYSLLFDGAGDGPVDALTYEDPARHAEVLHRIPENENDN